MSSEKKSFNPYAPSMDGEAPPSYTDIAGPSGSTMRVDMETGICQDPSVAPPSDPDAIKAIYGNISGVSLLGEAYTIIVLDDSESMSTFGYWNLARQWLGYIAPVIKTYSPNGVTIYCLNTEGSGLAKPDEGVAANGWNNLTDTTGIEAMFAESTPMGTTPVYDRLEHIIGPYLVRLANTSKPRPRPINILLLTDGAADDQEGVEELIGEICTELDKVKAPANQIGLQFIQIGDLEYAKDHIRKTTTNPAEIARLDQKAAEDLEMATGWLTRLDDWIKGNVQGVTRDIVDTKNASQMAAGGYTPKNLVKVLIGALSKRHDRMV